VDHEIGIRQKQHAEADETQEGQSIPSAGAVVQDGRKVEVLQRMEQG
jgi:hypothetical protein